jgi:hypothetical protein
MIFMMIGGMKMMNTSLNNLRERMVSATKTLEKVANTHRHYNELEYARVKGKIQGLNLAIGYLDEELKWQNDETC